MRYICGFIARIPLRLRLAFMHPREPHHPLQTLHQKRVNGSSILPFNGNKSLRHMYYSNDKHLQNCCTLIIMCMVTFSCSASTLVQPLSKRAVQNVWHLFPLINSDRKSDADEQNAAINFDTLHLCMLKSVLFDSNLTRYFTVRWMHI